MKSLYIFLLFFPISSDLFARIAGIPENPVNDNDITIASNFFRNMVILNKDDVGIPPCTGVKIFQTSKPAVPGPTLYILRNYSSDPSEKLIDFYKDKIPANWEYKDYYGTCYFWIGDEISSMVVQNPSTSISGANEFKKNVVRHKYDYHNLL